jgi:hypothetical protein
MMGAPRFDPPSTAVRKCDKNPSEFVVGIGIGIGIGIGMGIGIGVGIWIGIWIDTDSDPDPDPDPKKNAVITPLRLLGLGACRRGLDIWLARF